MANSKQATKRDRQRLKRTLCNRVTIGSMRSAIKKARQAMTNGDANKADLLKKATKLIDKAVSKGALKRNTASRYISRLARRANAK